MSTPKRRFARSSAISTCIWLMPGEDLFAGLLVAPAAQGLILFREAPDRR